MMERLMAPPTLYALVRAAIILAGGYVVARILSSAFARTARARLSGQHAMVGKKFIYYLVIILAFVSGLTELGFDFRVILGAAGIFTVALGFASQTSASNLISGLFLLAERPFLIGEVIQVGETTGEVISIDLLSVKLRTLDNLYVRVPNESLIKSNITNLTRFPIRRYDLQLSVAYKESIGHVRDILLDVADRNTLCLQEPKPLIIFQGFADSGVNLQFSVWAARENYLPLRNTMAEKVKEAFDATGVEIPFPHISIYAGSQTEPIPVTLRRQGSGADK